MNKIECKNNTKVICPYCDFNYICDWLLFLHRAIAGDTIKTKCENCNEEFEFKINIHVNFETFKK